MTGEETPSLASFFAQPADEDEPETTLAAFYAQPSEDDEDWEARQAAKESDPEPYVAPNAEITDEPFPGGGEGVTPETLGPLQDEPRWPTPTSLSDAQHEAAAIAYETGKTDVSPYGYVPEPQPWEVLRDNALAGLETYELADEFSRRVGGKVVGLVVQGEGFERLLYGINP